MNVEYIKAVNIELAERLFIINEYRLDRLYFCFGNFSKECALHISVCLDRGDLRSCNLDYILVLALSLVDDGIVVISEIFFCPLDDVFLGDLTHVVKLLDLVLPLCSVDE